MEDDQERERFGMENDYEDGQWIGGEFCYSKRKEKRHQTKDDVLYGIFASGDTDSDSEGSSKKKRKKDLSRKQQDLTKPLNFVSSGIVMPNEEINNNTKQENKKDEQDPGLGQGLGFNSEVNVDFPPTAFGKMIKEGALQRREKEKEKSKSTKSGLGKREAKDDGNVGVMKIISTIK
ncbi:hypothetical protein L2E82_49507 [Cichorium intybus]|uniref:Uncharacterized protein n=1 Tax=Cichorium intybus TaxID=13427 RepID=A0ACB8Z1A6_CICIN|nr:hypothetical protein L2E82_49507 [Cichorium intybus]